MKKIIILLSAMAVFGCSSNFNQQNDSYKAQLEAEAKELILSSPEMATADFKSYDKDPVLVSEIAESTLFRAFIAQYGDKFVLFFQTFPSVTHDYRTDCEVKRSSISETSVPVSIPAGDSKLLTFPKGKPIRWYSCNHVRLNDN